MVAKMKSLSKDDGENKKNGKNNDFACASRFFLATFLSSRCTTATYGTS